MFRVKDSWEKTPDFSHKPGKISVFLLSFRPFFCAVEDFAPFFDSILQKGRGRAFCRDP